MIFPINRAKHKILKHVYENPWCRITDVLKAANTSQSSGYSYIAEMVGAGLLMESKEGSKPLSRRIAPNFGEAGSMVFALLEAEKLQHLISRHAELKAPLAQFRAESGSIVDTALVFGSFARGAEGRDSDIDIFVLGKRGISRKLAAIQERCFITARNTVSMRVAETQSFVGALKSGDSFAAQIAKDHVVAVNPLGWVRILSAAEPSSHGI